MRVSFLLEAQWTSFFTDFLYFVVETSWVFIPSSLPLLDDVSGCTPSDIIDRRWDPAEWHRALSLPEIPNPVRNPDESDFPSTFLNVEIRDRGF